MEGHAMPHITTDDGVKLYYEEAGAGLPIIFVHEFAGDARSYEAQLRYFSRRYRCVAFNARGYPPSDAPADPEKYSQARARDDIRAVAVALGLDHPHVVGISMGAFATLHYGLTYPSEAQSLVVAGCGYGAEPSRRKQFQRESEAAAERFASVPMAQAAERYALGTTRVQFQNKDPRGWHEFRTMLAEHSAVGSALTLLGVQKRRPSLYDLTDTLKRITAPVLLMTGDEDEPCLAPTLMLKRTIPTSALVVLPRTGHAVNLEEPGLFHQFLDDFFHQVETGRWTARDPRSLSGAIL
jgi:pimeloyl-ACP methyl ester carboxylesterase